MFADGDLRATLDAQLEMVRRSVDDIPERDFRAADPSELATKLYERFVIEAVEVTEGAISVQAEDAEIDRRRFRDIDHGFPGASPTLRGTRVTYNVPYTGEETLFRLKPSTWTASFPYAVLGRGELRFIYDVPSSEVAGTKSRFDRDLALTRQWLGWSTKQVAEFDQQLASVIGSAVNSRGNRLASASEGLAALGLPVRRVEPARVQPQASKAEPVRTSGGASATGEYDVALSFAGEDRIYVQSVAKRIADAGARVFFDEFEAVSLWGKDLVEHLQDIYQNRARFCVLFISEHYVKKPWPTHERRSAQARALVAKEEYLLPARFDDSVLPGMPPTIGYVDLRNLSPDEFAKMVLAKVGIK